MKLLTTAALLLLSLALPASAQFWGAAGSTGIVDESCTTLYEFHNGTLRFKSTAATRGTSKSPSPARTPRPTRSSTPCI